jgi:hypothetical protein
MTTPPQLQAKDSREHGRWQAHSRIDIGLYSRFHQQSKAPNLEDIL